VKQTNRGKHETIPADECRIYTDGGARGNPGPAAAGGIIVGADGRVKAELSVFLGHATNNVAEYRALLLALTKARELGCRRILVCMDSELVVRQINGLYKVKDPKMREWYDRVRAALEGFAAWRVQHVPRGENAHADELVNRALDRHAEEAAGQ
jgi:ribonuclease HI